MVTCLCCLLARGEAETSGPRIVVEEHCPPHGSQVGGKEPESTCWRASSTFCFCYIWALSLLDAAAHIQVRSPEIAENTLNRHTQKCVLLISQAFLNPVKVAVKIIHDTWQIA